MPDRVTATLIHKREISDKAVLFYDAGYREIIMPKSQITVDETGQRTTSGRIVKVSMPAWLAEAKGFDLGALDQAEGDLEVVDLGDRWSP